MGKNKQKKSYLKGKRAKETILKLRMGQLGNIETVKSVVR